MVNTDIINAYLGSSQVDKIMLGSEQVYPTAEPEYDKKYLTFRITTPGKVVWYASSSSAGSKTIQYSKDKGRTWTSLASANNTSNGFDVVAGDEVWFKGENTGYGNTNANNIHTFMNTTAGLILEGNIMSMLHGDNFTGQTQLSTTYTFRSFFQGIPCEDAGNLILPATAITEGCYRNLLPNTPIATAPALPAMTLSQACYMNMFLGCKNLTRTPDLLAPVLTRECYSGMFFLETSGGQLQYCRCLAIDKTATNCVSNFIRSGYVPRTGTFVKAAGVSWEIGGNNGIPAGWTVIEEGDKLTFESSDGVTGDGQQYSPGMWDMTQTISNIASYTLYYGGEVVTADTHVTIRNDWDGSIDYDTEETGMVWSGVTYGYGYGDETILLTINYSAQTGTAELVVGYTPPVPPEPEDTCADWEGAGYSSYEECRCAMYGDYCDDPCAGYSSQEECDCVMNGGTWDGVNCNMMDEPHPEEPD